MEQDYSKLTDEQIELLEKQTARVLVQALQEYSREAKVIFEQTPADSKSEVIVLAEDLVQYALEVAEAYPINKRYAGFIDYKRVRWLGLPYALVPQVLLVDAKASTENNRDTLQQSQLPMDADFESGDAQHSMVAGVQPHMDLATATGGSIKAITTSMFVHFYYKEVVGAVAPPYRRLHGIFVVSLPHSRLKPKYNPTAQESFFGQGKHSPARQEIPRIRVYFKRLAKMCTWRFQQLNFKDVAVDTYAEPVWIDDDPTTGKPVKTSFDYLGR